MCSVGHQRACSGSCQTLPFHQGFMIKNNRAAGEKIVKSNNYVMS